MSAKILGVVLATVCIATPGAATARPMEGRLGLGGQLDSGLIGPALSIRYWVSDLGIEGLFGFRTQKSTPDQAGFREYRIGARMLYAVTRTKLTNLSVGVGLSTFIRDSAVDSENPLLLDLLISPGFHLSDQLAVSGQVVISVVLQQSPLYSVSPTSWGASFHYYF